MRINKLSNTKLMYLPQMLVVACDFDSALAFSESPQDEPVTLIRRLLFLKALRMSLLLILIRLLRVFSVGFLFFFWRHKSRIGILCNKFL